MRFAIDVVFLDQALRVVADLRHASGRGGSRTGAAPATYSSCRPARPRRGRCEPGTALAFREIETNGLLDLALRA